MIDVPEMVLRAARAISKERFLDGGIEDDDGFDDVSPNVQSQLITEARAVLMALREPTDAMTKAAARPSEMATGAGGLVDYEAKAAWVAMIDKALDQ